MTPVEHTADREVQHDDGKPNHLMIQTSSLSSFASRSADSRVFWQGTIKVSCRVIVFVLTLSVTERSRNHVPFLLKKSISTVNTCFP